MNTLRVLLNQLSSRDLVQHQYILQGGVRWYANCGFSHRRSCPSDRNALRNPPRQHVPTVYWLRHHADRHLE